MGWRRPLLPGESGTFPLAVASGGRYLQTAAGAPILLRGAVGWSAMVALDDTGRDAWLDDIVSIGCNAVICNLIEKLWSPSPPEDAFGELPFSATLGGGEVDFTAPNEAYWAKRDAFIDACAARNIYALLAQAYWGYAGASPVEGWSDAIAANGSTRRTAYGNWLGSRYASRTNIGWINYGDALPDATGRGYVKEIQDGIKATDMAGRLHLSHFARGSLSSDDSTVAWDINAAYSAGGSTSPRVHSVVLDGWAADAGPVILFEDEYAHRASGTLTAQQLRKESWDAWLSGACGKFHGDEYVWPFDVANANAASPQGHWYDHDTDTGAQEASTAGAFIAARAWWLLAPSTGAELVTSGGGTVNTDGYKPRALASDGSWGAVYVADGTTVTVDLSLFSATVTARWFDPTDGTYSAVTGGPTFAASGTHAFVASSEVGNNAAGGTDWVLVLEVSPV